MRQPTWDENWDVFFSYLRRDEGVLWAGQPVVGLRFRPADFNLVPISLAAVAYAIFFIETAPTFSEPWLNYLRDAWVLIFCVAGTAGRFFGDAFIRRRTYYAVTNDRILILRRWPWRRFVSLSLTQLPELTLEEEEDGTGTIFFGPRSTLLRGQGPPQFRMIDRAGYVCHLIRVTRDQLKPCA
jgi:hypothetical protein